MRILLAVIILLTGTPAYATVAPISVKPNSTPKLGTSITRRQFDRQRLRFYQREIVGEYKRVGVRDPKWDGAAIKFLERQAAQMVRGWPDNMNLPGTRPFSEPSVDESCTDPMVSRSLERRSGGMGIVRGMRF